LPKIVDSTGIIGQATALPGAPVIAGIAGDQQSSLIGQGCVAPGQAKITFGTGGMLDVCVGPDRPAFDTQSEHGTFPIVAWLADGVPMWGIEAVMLAAGSNVEWLRDDLGIIDDAAASHDAAASVESTDGVVYVPAPLGLGTPNWDFGARGTLLGITRGTTSAHVVRAVLEGVANRGADLVEAAEADTGFDLPTLRVDGGMSANPTFAQAFADACGRPVELAAEAESTTLGAAYLAGLATDVWSSWDDIATLWKPRAVVEPAGTVDREQWKSAVGRAEGWYPDLSAINF
jgi:glycerol kinase